MHQEIIHQFDAILGHTMEKINAFVHKDLAQTAVSLANIVQCVEDQVGSLSNDSPNQILQYILNGTRVYQPLIFQKLSDRAMKRRNKFKPPTIANFLWAYASNGHIDKNVFQSFIPKLKTLLGRCSTRDLAIIAWAYATVAGVHAPSLFNDSFVQICQTRKDDFTLEELCQLHQWNLWQKELKSDINLPSELKGKCYQSFISRDPNPSSMQYDVISTLAYTGLHPKKEVLTHSGYSIDAKVEVNGKKIGIEVDGPFHFLGKKPSGSTILKRRQIYNLENLTLVSVPYWEWHEFGKDGKKKEKYLCSLLGLDLDDDIDEGFAAEIRVVPSPPLGIDYSKMTITELKDMLHSKGLKVSGNKAELIERLEQDTVERLLL